MASPNAIFTELVSTTFRKHSKDIKDNVSKYGAAVVVLGVRRTESIRRMRTVDKYENERGSNLNPHSSITGAYIFRPIVDLTTDDVWEILGSFPGRAPVSLHKELVWVWQDSLPGIGKE